MRPPGNLLALTLMLGLTNAASAGNRPFVAVGADQAANLIVGNTVVFEPHSKTRYGASRRYYQSLDRVYECWKDECGTHGVRITRGRICDTDQLTDCDAADGRWSFELPAREGAHRGARIGSFIVTLPYGGGFEANPEWRARYLGPGWELAKVRGGEEVHPILKGNVTGFPDFTVPPGPLEPVTVDAKDALPGTEDDHGQSAGHGLGKLFPGNTLVNTDGTIAPCLKGAEYYASGGRLFSIGCDQQNDRRDGVRYSIWLLRWRMQGGRFCTTSRMEPNRYVCLTGSGHNDAVISKGGPYPPPPGRLAVQIPSSENASLLRGNIFHFKYSR